MCSYLTVCSLHIHRFITVVPRVLVWGRIWMQHALISALLGDLLVHHHRMASYLHPYPLILIAILMSALQMVLKCADIGHLTVDPKTHKQWAFLLEEEFFRQVRCLLKHGAEPRQIICCVDIDS